MRLSPFQAALLLAAVAAFGYLLVAAPGDAADLALRLAPVMAFVALISVVVNLAAPVGAFRAVIAAVGPRTGHPWRTWLTVAVLSLVATTFLSLDTTAILLTPVAVALAKRDGLPAVGLGLTVVWVANIGSLLLPVSNLTNLLAVASPHFAGILDFLSHSAVPAVTATAVVLLAAGLRFRSGQGGAAQEGVALDRPVPGPLLRLSLVVLGVMLPLLASPVPYWLTAGVGAAVMLTACALRAPRHIGLGLVPWSSILLAVSVSAVTAALHTGGVTSFLTGAFSGWEQSLPGLLGIAFAGAGLSNVINNIPAFLALETAVDGPVGMLALLIGTNAGPLITPWASLATLLWWDQLRRNGIHARWSAFVLPGLVLAPVAVAVPTVALWLTS